jgi:polar amino acid transport system substrate-binding protein
VNIFTDTDNSEVVKAHRIGIIKGVSDTEFAPLQNITRQEICAMLVRCIDKAVEDADIGSYNDNVFADIGNIGNWALPSVQYAFDNSIIRGVGGGRIDPLGLTTCEQAIVLSYRVYARFGSKSSGLKTVEPGVLIMATDTQFPPYEFLEGGKVVGIDVEIAEAIAVKLGLALRIDDVGFSAVIPAVADGKADIGMASITVNEARMQIVDFSAPYATGVQVIVTSEKSPVSQANDLFTGGVSYKIGVLESSIGDHYSTWDFEEEGNSEIHRFSGWSGALQALIAGQIDCVIMDNEAAKAFVAMNPGLLILETEFTMESYAIAVSQDNAELRNAVNNALRELIADGTVARILEKYITD